MISIKKIIYLAAIAILTLNCKKAEKESSKSITDPVITQVTLPEITTSSVTNITTVSAASGGTTISNGGAPITERGMVISLSPNPTINNTKFGTTSITGAGDFTAELTGLKASTKYFLRSYAINRVGVGYGNEVVFTTTLIGNAGFNFTPMYIVGSSLATCDVEITTDGGDPITERGLCWSIAANPTISNNKVKHNSLGTGKFRTIITGLLERTDYHVRAYAINAKGVSYSDDIAFKTIAKGKITYTFNKATNPTAEQLAAYERLQVAVDSAVWYLSNYTSATKHVYLNYVEGTPTADANNEGWMRFGTGIGYQNLRTMLHEMNHTLGTGTTDWWKGKIVDGKFQGQNTNALLKKIQNTATAQLSGDTQHWWPFGLNQNSEVTSSWDYVYNCLLIEAMRKDGLPTSTSGAFQQ